MHHPLLLTSGPSCLPSPLFQIPFFLLQEDFHAVNSLLGNIPTVLTALTLVGGHFSGWSLILRNGQLCLSSRGTWHLAYALADGMKPMQFVFSLDQHRITSRTEHQCETLRDRDHWFLAEGICSLTLTVEFLCLLINNAFPDRSL